MFLVLKENTIVITSNNKAKTGFIVAPAAKTGTSIDLCIQIPKQTK